MCVLHLSQPQTYSTIQHNTPVSVLPSRLPLPSKRSPNPTAAKCARCSPQSRLFTFVRCFCGHPEALYTIHRVRIVLMLLPNRCVALYDGQLSDFGHHKQRTRSTSTTSTTWCTRTCALLPSSAYAPLLCIAVLFSHRF